MRKPARQEVGVGVSTGVAAPLGEYRLAVGIVTGRLVVAGCLKVEAGLQGVSAEYLGKIVRDRRKLLLRIKRTGDLESAGLDQVGISAAPTGQRWNLFSSRF